MDKQNYKHEANYMSSQDRLGDPDIWNRLKPSWRYLRNLPHDTSVNVLSVPAAMLLTPERFDIAIKCLYGRLWRNESAPLWRKLVYSAQASRITGPSPVIKEHDGSKKSGLAQFLSRFQELLRDSPPENLPIVPVGEALIAFDGSHRIAAAICTNRKIEVAHIAAPSPCLGDATFFSSSLHGHKPCPSEILDEAAIEYCRIKKGLSLCLIFPTVQSEAHAIACLRDAGRIVYRKDIVLSPKCGHALLRQVYYGHAWFQGLQDEMETDGFLHKVRSCFPLLGVVRVLLIDGLDANARLGVKHQIRSHYRIGNHSIHITDTDEEVLLIARVVFNDNSIALLRAGVGGNRKFEEQLFIYKKWLESKGLDCESFVIDGGAVLGLLNLRDCRDIDFLFHGDVGCLPALPEKVDCHNGLARYHTHKIGDLVGDPRLHCWYMGAKFCTLPVVSRMKWRRGEAKDHADIVLLQAKVKHFRKSSNLHLTDQLTFGSAKLLSNVWVMVQILKRTIKSAMRSIR
ncbi:MAG: hypothetical protein OXF74_08505 [Rhodobacteraceae bacterium]|nr:hypothetical protein [Paracoccaceae bacterium]